MSDQPPSYPSYPGSGGDEQGDRPDESGQPQSGQPQPGEQTGQPQSGQPQPAHPEAGQPQTGQPQPGQPQTGQYGQPQPGSGQGQPAPAQGAYGAPYGSPYGYGPSPYGTGDPERRPGTVTGACAITWVLAGLSAVLFGLSLIALLVAQDEVVDVIREQPGFEDTGISADAAAGAAAGFVAVFLVWSLIAIALAVGAFRRSNVARIALVVSAVFSAIFSLVAIGSLISVVTLAGSIAAIVLLFMGGANQWYSRRGTAGPDGPAPYGGSGWPAQG